MQKIDCWQPFGDATKDVPQAPPFVKKGVHYCHCDLPLERRIAGPTSKRPESPYWGCAKWQPEGQHGAYKAWIWEGDMENAHRKWERANGSEPCVTKRWLAETAEGRCFEGGGLGKVAGNGRKRRSQMGNGKGLREMLGSIDVKAEEVEDDDDFIDRDKDTHWGRTSWQQVEGDGEEDEGEEKSTVKAHHFIDLTTSDQEDEQSDHRRLRALQMEVKALKKENEVLKVENKALAKDLEGEKEVVELKNRETAILNEKVEAREDLIRQLKGEGAVVKKQEE
ncbi:uncharacterized protein QC761_0001870 [Podospora bellae-mahoneyi]|uniref:Uncharacterized protein n=1 Tax=Podospora bellae-mahoneyi TaxID=2093777 RepID=A0ABR0FUY6_9PEZI|nr:hypothetical protein QC761_0001870 [Podospora bellae-mahoneyi]